MFWRRYTVHVDGKDTLLRNVKWERAMRFACSHPDLDVRVLDSKGRVVVWRDDPKAPSA